MFFTDTLNGIIVGGLPGTSLILHTKDGGASWSTINSPVSEYLRGVFFPSSKIGYIVGWNGTILKTSDSGNSWMPQTSVDAYGNLDVYFNNDSVGYIVGGSQNYAGIQKTIDVGKSWTAQIAPVNQGLVGVFFPSNEIGFCVGANGTILKTTNGGITNANDAAIKKLNFKIYPNPSHDQTTIDLENNECKNCFVSIYNIYGKLSDNVPLESSKQAINISILKAGMYLINIKGNNVNLSIPFIKE